MLRSKEDYLKAIVKNICENVDDPQINKDTSFEEYKILTNMQGVQVDFNDPKWVEFMFCLVSQERDNEELRDLVVAALNKFRFLNPRKNKKHDELLGVVLSVELTRNRDYYEMISEYVLKNYPETESGNMAFAILKSTGLPFSIGLSDPVYKKAKEVYRGITKVTNNDKNS